MRKFYGLPRPWDPHYAIPDYVMAEPPERGTMTTQWLPRGTISEVIPDYKLGATKRMDFGMSHGKKGAGSALGSLAGSTLGGSTLAGSTLAGSTLAGDTLGSTQFQLEPMGADEGTTAVVKAGPPTLTTMSPRNRNLAIAAVAIAGAWYFFKKKKRR